MSFEGYVRANTEVIVTIGPFPDVGDGFTPQTDITLGGNEAELIKHGSTSVVDISGATWAAVTNCRGYYSLTLTTSLTDTEGMVTVIVQDDSDCLPVRNSFMVMAEAAWDSMFAAKDAGFMDVNIKTVGRADTQETEANNLESACSNYSVTRGLTGTAIPAAVAAAAGGIPLSAAGSLAMDTLADWVDGGRLDLILDIIAADTTTDIPAKLLKYIQLLARSDAAIETDNATELTAINADGGSGAGNFSAQTDAVEALKALLDDARAEPGQGAPPVNPDAMTKIDYLYKMWRNKKDNDGSVRNLYNDAGAVVDQKSSVAEAGGTTTLGEIASGP